MSRFTVTVYAKTTVEVEADTKEQAEEAAVHERVAGRIVYSERVVVKKVAQ